MIAVPSHPCLPCDPAREAPEAYGELDRDNVATCTVRVRWGLQRSQDERAPGCGARIALCHGCGLRTRIDGAPCKACGGDQKPEAVRVADVERAPSASVQGVECGPSVASGVVGVGSIGDGGAGRSRQGDAGPRREAKAKAPGKPRAPTKRVAKGKAAPDGPELPFLK